jgi:shikimate dehydrogenase/3-dehydroquinate dehydratase type I
MRICVSIVEPTLEKVMGSAQEAIRGGADMLEVRFDRMSKLPSDLSALASLPVPKIATLRPREQGGMWKGDDSDRKRFFERAMDIFQMVDLELGSELIDALRPSPGIEVICSHHDFTSTPGPERIVDIMEKAWEMGEIAKAAFTVKGPKDLLSLERASRALPNRRKVLIGMGEMGGLTRARADLLGCDFAYASLSAGKEAAPGQLDLPTLKGLGEEPIIVGITGLPLSHSLSPPMHEAAFRRMGIPGAYFAFPVESEGLEDLIEVIRRYRMRGINVTIPHKESVMPLLDSIEEKAARVGAVNTIVNDHGHLVGMNTDVIGVERTFARAGVEARGARALVIGAGGAAHSCCAFLCDNGADVTVVNRTHRRAQGLENDFLCVRALPQSVALEERYDVVVNCTPLGMEGFPDRSPIPAEVFREDQFVMDTVYNPPETRFARDAREKGAKVCSGIEMLIYQAIAAFEVWTGSSPPYEVMAGPVRERLK